MQPFKMLPCLGEFLPEMIEKQPDGADAVIVAGDDVIHKVGIRVGVHQGHDGDFEPARLGNGDVFVGDVHHEERGGRAVEIHDAFQIFMEAGGFPSKAGDFLFAKFLEDAFGFITPDFPQTVDALANGLQVGEGSSQPAFRHVVHVTLFSHLPDGFLSLFLGADEKNIPAVLQERTKEGEGFLDFDEGFGDVDDVNAVSRVENVFAHLGVPTIGLVAEVDAGLHQVDNR